MPSGVVAAARRRRTRVEEFRGRFEFLEMCEKESLLIEDDEPGRRTKMLRRGGQNKLFSSIAFNGAEINGKWRWIRLFLQLEAVETTLAYCYEAQLSGNDVKWWPPL